MQILEVARVNLVRAAAVGVAAFAVNLIQPTDDARSDGIFSGGLFEFSGSSRLTSRTVIPNAPSIGLDQNSKALQHYNSGDFQAARKLWEEAAKKGDIFAKWMLARMYHYGQGVAADDRQALTYYRGVAQGFNGDRSKKTRFDITVDATYWVGYFLHIGSSSAGLKKNPRRAFMLFNLAAKNGHAAAQLEVGRAYLNGKVIKRNQKMGKRWLMASANKRHAPAMALLGTIYWAGKVARKSRSKGLMWYTLAKENACASINPEIYDRYEEVYTDATAAERSKAETFVYRWNQQNPTNDGGGAYHLQDCG
jgi:hypothetical protein